MRIFHRFDTDEPSIIQDLEQSGIRWEDHGIEGLAARFAVIAEDDIAWHRVRARLRALSSLKGSMEESVWTEFSDSDRGNATTLEMSPDWHHCFPAPAKNFEYLRTTYREVCRDCGAHGEQIAPFRVDRVPKWGRRSILQLNWVFDEFFVTPEAWAAVFEPLGGRMRRVLLNKNGAELKNIVQLEVSEHRRLELPRGRGRVCRACRREIFPAPSRGFFPNAIGKHGHIFRSVQYFEGQHPFQAILVSKHLYGAIRTAGLIGANFNPCNPQPE